MAGATGKVRMTRPGLMEAFPGFGRDYWGGALKELEEAGMVKRGSYQAGPQKQWNNFEDITDLGWMYLRDWMPRSDNPTAEWGAGVGKPVVLFSENQLINPNNITSLTSKEVAREDPREEFTTTYMPMEDNVPYDFFKNGEPADDYTQESLEDRLKFRQKKMDEGKTEFTSTRSKKFGTRHNLAIDQWGSNEIAYEFMERLTKYFHIKNNIAIQRITGAFASMRKAQDTNGTVDYKMLDLFFEVTKFDKIDDGNHAWRLFMTRAPELAVQAKRMIQTPEEKETAATQAAKSQEWLSE
jgi:uncharacterized protein (DUF2384 family)